MRQSKTTPKQLTVAYQTVLRYGILCNAIALGLCIAPAMATDPVVFPTDSIDTTLADIVYENHTGIKGALSSDVGGDFIANGTNKVIFQNNTSTDHGAGIYYKNGLSADNVVFNTDVSFLNNEVLSTATSGSGAGVFISGGNVSFFGANNIFDNNDMNAQITSSRQYKVGGGAISNQSYAKDSAPNKNQELNANMIIGKTDGTSINTFQNNDSSTNGGAIMNRALKGGAQNDNDGNACLTINGVTTFDNNTAVINGGAIYNIATGGNTSELNLNNGTYTFTNNKAGGLGGALYNSGTTTIDGAATFSGNKSAYIDADNYTDNDIYNVGTLNLNAVAGKTISMAGGIDGDSETVATNITNITGAGVVETVALNNQTVSVGSGFDTVELHVTTGSGLAGSTVAVNNGATFNSVDNVINDYSGIVTLNNGSNIKGDIDLTAWIADTYAADDGANITYRMANPLNLSNSQQTEKEIAVTNSGATVNAGTDFYWANSDVGLVLTSGGEGTGTVKINGFAGGINSAVDVTDSSEQDIEYTLTSVTETFDGNGGTDNVIEKANFAITGNGNDENNSNKLVLANDLVVGEESTLALESIVLKHDDTSETVEKIDNQSTLNVHNSTLDVNVSNSGTATVSGSRLVAGKLVENKVGATMTILNSQVDADFNNAGILYSDPTTYTATVSNTGTANFDDDIFTGTAVLANSGTANLTNGVTFENGASIQGTGTTNLVNGTTHFNNTESTNIVKLASGAKFDGTLVNSGMVDTRNDNIDNVTGSVSGGYLYVDANLTGNGAIDTFASSNGATIKQINLTESSYGTAKSYSLNTGGADVDANVKVTGATNYYTKVDANGGNVVFSDKLMNTSGMHEQIGDWGDGNYISASTNYDTTTDSYSDTTGQTVGQALFTLDGQVKTNADAIADLDTAIGSLSTLDTTNGVLDSTASVATNLQNLDTALNNVRTNAAAQNQLTLNQAVAYTDERVDRLDKELSSGVASAVALSSVAVSNVHRGEVSVGAGYGYYNGRSAAAFGAAMGLTNRWSVNAGAGVSDADVSFRAGTNYKFKLF